MLQVDGHGYSPTILHRILHTVGVTSSFEVAEVALKVVGEISISARHINNLTSEIGQQLAADRDQRTERYVNQPLPRPASRADSPPDLAAVFCDGGRMQTREAGPHGVHSAHWRETKNAAFHRMQSVSFANDPQPDLPDCFRNEAYVEKLVKGLKSQKNEGREEPVTSEEEDSASSGARATAAPSETVEWRPKPLFCTCLSSLASSDEFGAMMAAEADARGFFTAPKKAFLGDGLSYNWTIQKRWFADFVPIVDFVHVVEYLYHTARAVHDQAAIRWQQYVAWAVACWQGRGDEVIAELRAWQQRHGPPPPGEDVPDTDARKVVQTTVTYLTNNHGRMDYPRYRLQGLPVTSSLAESLVKQMNKRVKGTEKFWNDGASGEAILQLRAAVISDDARLATWIRTRPISPFSPRCRAGTLATSV